MRFFQFSPFWTAVKQVRSFRFLLALGLMLLSMESVARVAPYLIAKQVHQRFLYSKSEWLLDFTNQGKMLTWMANERGARGDLYHGQPIQIAVLGSSTSIDGLLDQEETWLQQLKAKLGRNRVHVDNYARDGATGGDAIEILQEFQKTGQRYDILLLMVLVNPSNRRDVPTREAFLYWGNWDRTGPEPVVGPRLLYRRLRHQARSEARMQALMNLVSGLFMPVEAPSKHPPRLSRSNRKLRKSGKVKLVDVPWPFDEEDRQWIADETLKVLNEAAQVANRVYLITQPVAYDADQHPGVPDKWFSLYPVKGEENSYYSNKSVVDSIRTRNAIMEQVARWHGTPVIDLDGYMRPLLRDRDDLFDDKWHFSPSGAEAAAEYVAMQLGIINPPWIYRGNESSRAD